MSAPVVVLVNPAARQGAAPRLYARLRPRLAARGPHQEVALEDDGRWRERIDAALDAGVRVFVAAGGDGTVSALAAALLGSPTRPPLSELALGAIGLGSSNDFHKPFGRRWHGVPVRLDAAQAVPRDVARARWEDAEGRCHERPFLVSASVGATADANAFFGGGDAVLRRLKPHLPGAAIVYAAVRTLARHRLRPARLVVGGKEEAVPLNSLSVAKTAFLAGAFRYDTPVHPADGRLSVNLCEGMPRLRLLATLASLARGRFAGRRGTRHWSAETVELHVTRPAALELDGEVFQARTVWFDLWPERLPICA